MYARPPNRHSKQYVTNGDAPLDHVHNKGDALFFETFKMDPPQHYGRHAGFPHVQRSRTAFSELTIASARPKTARRWRHGDGRMAHQNKL